MLVILSNWLLVAAFAGAGLFNAIGTTATQGSFVRWGYPRWWCRVTGALEIAVAALIAFLSLTWSAWSRVPWSSLLQFSPFCATANSAT